MQLVKQVEYVREKWCVFKKIPPHHKHVYHTNTHTAGGTLRALHKISMVVAMPGCTTHIFAARITVGIYYNY